MHDFTDLCSIKIGLLGNGFNECRKSTLVKIERVIKIAIQIGAQNVGLKIKYSD